MVAAVFMGMGEPLLNLPSVLRAHEVLVGDVGIGARHITISTVGECHCCLLLADVWRYMLSSTDH